MLLCEPIPGEHPTEVYSKYCKLHLPIESLKMALTGDWAKVLINVHMKGHFQISLVNSISCYINFTMMSLLQLTLPSANKAYKVFL